MKLSLPSMMKTILLARWFIKLVMIMEWNSFLDWIWKMTKKLFTKIELLEKQIAEEVKEKYALYKRIKELNEELRALKNISPEMSSISGPDEIQRYKT